MNKWEQIRRMYENEYGFDRFIQLCRDSRFSVDCSGFGITAQGICAMMPPLELAALMWTKRNWTRYYKHYKCDQPAVTAVADESRGYGE